MVLASRHEAAGLLEHALQHRKNILINRQKILSQIYQINYGGTWRQEIFLCVELVCVNLKINAVFGISITGIHHTIWLKLQILTEGQSWGELIGDITGRYC